MLRVLAVTTATRSDVLPEIPTLAEFVPGYAENNGMDSVRRKTWKRASLPVGVGFGPGTTR
jgi:hypothetical protein